MQCAYLGQTDECCYGVTWTDWGFHGALSLPCHSLQMLSELASDTADKQPINSQFGQ